jgi:uncharacterized protein
MQKTRLFRRIALALLVAAVAIYIGICTYFYLMQERMLFQAKTLPQDYVFSFPRPFEEIRLPMGDGTIMDALLFHSNPSKGVVFFLHGTAGNLSIHGGTADFFRTRGFDFFAIDYRGYGKSQGRIKSEAQFYDDAEMAYNWLLKRYPENKIHVLGVSLGTTVAAKVASTHHPRNLVLAAPFVSILDYMHMRYPFLPAFILKYPLRTDLNIQACSSPVTLIHGTADKLALFSNSERLKTLIPSNSRLIPVPGVGHNGILRTDVFRNAMTEILLQGEAKIAVRN